MKGEGKSSSKLLQTGFISFPQFYISLGVRAGGINDFADSPDKPWTNGASKAVYRFYQSQDSWYRSWTSPELIVDSVNVYAL